MYTRDMGINSESIQPETHSITGVNVIEEGSVTFAIRSQIEQYVETPLIPACQILWDKGIKTLMSSANPKDVGNAAYIDFDWNTLSGRNQKIAEEMLGKKFVLHGYKDVPAIKINILPVTNETTVEQVEEKATEIAKCFKKQKAGWRPKYAIE